MSQNCFFRKHHKVFCGDCKKILNFVWDIWFEYYGELIFWDFSQKFYFRKIISKLDIKYKCEISQFLGKCFVHAKHLTLKFIRILGKICFFEVKFQNVWFKYSMKKIIYYQINSINQKLSTQSLDYYINLKIIIKSALICFYLEK
jgi:hypothetical protein